MSFFVVFSKDAMRRDILSRYDNLKGIYKNFRQTFALNPVNSNLDTSLSTNLD